MNKETLMGMIIQITAKAPSDDTRALIAYCTANGLHFNCIYDQKNDIIPDVYVGSMGLFSYAGSTPESLNSFLIGV